jgi:hypothetical protein
MKGVASTAFAHNVNYVSLTGAPFKIAVASAIGAATGVIGGVIGRIGRLGVSPGA